ncbi:MAG: IS21-like element helper ATPase IstB [Spirochaetota bacterium]
MDMSYHLSDNLKRLRMPAVIENLELRAREATDHNLGYVEFLSLLIQDEIDSRESNNLAKRLKAARLQPHMSFEAFDFHFNAESLLPKTLNDLATCHFVQEKRNLVLCGPPGIGKTHIAQAIGHEVCRRGSEVLFSKTHKTLEELSDALSPKRVQRLWKRIVHVPLLILDDFGFRRYSAEEAELLYAISDERLGTGSTIITSNRPAEDWFGVFPDPVIGGAVLDRIASGAQKIIVEKAKSYRKYGLSKPKQFTKDRDSV